MPWNSTSPTGSNSVKANRTPMQQNTTYIETTMGNSVVGTNTAGTRDHFWNVSSDLDGRHRFIQSVGFTVGGTPTDPLVGTNMDGVQYLRQDNADSGRIQGFYRNVNNIYQHIPALLTGVFEVGSSFTDMVTVPANVYGDIFMFRAASDGSLTIQTGIFKSTATGVSVAAIGLVNSTGSSGTEFTSLIFARNGFAIQVKTTGADDDNNWQYRITYRAN